MLQLCRLPKTGSTADAIRKMDSRILKDIFGSTIMSRSYAYIGEIESVEISPGFAETTIIGTEAYDVVIKISGGNLYGECSCPYNGCCKHLAAFIQHLRDSEEDENLDEINIEEEIVAKAENKMVVKSDFEKWVNEQTPATLKKLVLQLATPTFRESIEMQQASPEVQLKAFQKLEKKVKNFVDKVDQYGPDEFEDELIKHLNALRTCWATNPLEITKLLSWILNKINTAQNEGYLYDSYEDEIFDGIELARHMSEFTAAQPNALISDIFQQIITSFRGSEYMATDHYITETFELLPDNKVLLLKNTILSYPILQYSEDYYKQLIWKRLKNILTNKEQEIFMNNYQDDPYFNMALAALYQSEGAFEKAITVLEKALAPRENSSAKTYFPSSEYFEMYEKRIELEVVHRKSAELRHWLKRYISETGTAESLQFAIQHLPDLQERFEEKLKKANLHGYALFLEHANRLTEILDLFKEHQKVFTTDRQYDFFVRQKEALPTEAASVFYQVLDEALQIASEYYYQKVVEVLLHLKKITDAPSYRKTVTEIRGTYKRRRNLMALMDKSKL